MSAYSMVNRDTKNSYYSKIDSVLPKDILTQKARGIFALRKYPALSPGVSAVHGATFLLPQNLKRIEFLDNDREWFARPCPVTPRHGFVESRPVYTLHEAKAVLEEARAVDPQAEVIVMPKLRGKFSGIATNAGVSWGKGHDGVTSAVGKTVTIPTPMTTPKQWIRAFSGGIGWQMENMGSPIQGVPYVELVEDFGEMYAVQFRDGPPSHATADYVPKSFIAQRVLKAEGDLLEWEAKIKAAAEEEGVVVHSYNGSLSSHYAVHALANGIPVITSKQHIIPGQYIKATDNRVPDLTGTDYQKIGWYIDKWLMYGHPELTHERQVPVIATAIAGVHAMAGWGNDPLLLSLRAMSVVTLLRYISAACLGELRHWWGAGPGATHGSSPTTEIKNCFHLKGRQRHRVYVDVLGEPSLRRIEQCMETCAVDFYTKGWRHSSNNSRRNPQRHYGYGGPKWAVATEAGHKLAKVMNAFQAAPTKDNWKEVVMAANVALHTVHNNGQTLNKWLQTSDFERISLAPSTGFMNAYAAQVALGMIVPEKE